MKKNIDLNKTAIVSYFLSNYESFEWERDDNDGELSTHLKNYSYQLFSNREGCYLQAIRDGEYLGPTIDSKDFPEVEELRSKVWDFVNECKEDEKWKNILNDLLNGDESE